MKEKHHMAATSVREVRDTAGAKNAKADRPASEEHDKTKEELIRKLNDDLSREYQAIVMYTTYAALVDGPYRPQLAAFFRSEIAGELGHAQFLAEKIAALGGTPSTEVATVPPAKEPRAMLEAVLQAEEQAISSYLERIDQAEAFGDIGLKVQLENIIAEETGHRDEVRRILEGWERPKR
jgi:bacterioferritin